MFGLKNYKFILPFFISSVFVILYLISNSNVFLKTKEGFFTSCISIFISWVVGMIFDDKEGFC